MQTIQRAAQAEPLTLDDIRHFADRLQRQLVATDLGDWRQADVRRELFRAAEACAAAATAMERG